MTDAVAVSPVSRTNRK